MSRKIGLALGSGASRGWAHIGVIEALEEAGIHPDFMAGTSIGAYVGAVCAADGLQRIKDFALDMDWKKVIAYVDLVFPRSGFLDGRKVTDMLPELMQVEAFEELKIPFAVVATDMKNGEEVVFKSGKITPAVRASISVPGILIPVHYQDRWLIDGGVVNPLPVDVVRGMGADIVIAVDLNSEKISAKDREESKAQDDINQFLEKNSSALLKNLKKQYGTAGKKISQKIDAWFSTEEKAPRVIEVTSRALYILERSVTKANLKLHKPDILIQPKLGHLDMFDFHEAASAIKEGNKSTQQVLSKLKDML